MTTDPTKSTTEVLADVSQAQWLWKSPELLAIAVAVVKFFVEREGEHFTDEVDLKFVRDEDKNLIGNTWLPLKNRGLLAMTDKWRRFHKAGIKIARGLAIQAGELFSGEGIFEAEQIASAGKPDGFIGGVTGGFTDRQV